MTPKYNLGAQRTEYIKEKQIENAVPCVFEHTRKVTLIENEDERSEPNCGVCQ